MGVTGINPGKLVTINVGGAKWTVAESAAPQLQGFLNDMVASGAMQHPTSSGGYVDRWVNIKGVPQVGHPSNHARGTAIDVSAVANAQGSKNTTFNEAKTRELAAKWGVKWGIDFPTPDPMHFEVAGKGATTKGKNVGLYGATKAAVDRGVAAVSKPAVTGTSYVAGSVPTTAIGSAAVSTAAPQINILDVLAQALGLVQAQQPAQVDLSSYVQQVAAQRSAALTDELATIERMKADAINRVRAQYGISQQGLATASAGAGVDLGAIGALNTAPGATTDIAAQMAALGYNPSLATSQVAPDLATLAAQQAATGGLIGGITAGTQAGINDTMSQQLAAMQSASLGDLETAAALQALKTKAASNADAQNFAQQMQALAAQANIANEQNRIPQLLQAISAVGGLQQANAQLAQSGTGLAIEAARMEQDAQQFAATYGLNVQELIAKIKANALNDKLTTAHIANTEADTDYRKAQTEAAKNPTATLTAAEQTRQRSIAAAAPQNKSLISAYKASNIAPAVKKAGSARAAFSSVNVKTIPSNQIDTILVAFALDGDVEGARSFVDNYWRNQDIVKNAGKSAKTAAKKSEAVQKELNDRKTTSMNTYYRLVGQGRLGMTPEDFAAYPDSFITG